MPRREARGGNPDDGGSIHVRSPFRRVQTPAYSISTARSIPGPARRDDAESFLIGKRRQRIFQMRRGDRTRRVQQGGHLFAAFIAVSSAAVDHHLLATVKVFFVRCAVSSFLPLTLHGTFAGDLGEH